MCFAEIMAWQPPDAGSQPVPIGSRFIGVSLQPAIPRRVAPQQSPLPLHQSPRILAQSQSGEAIKCAAQLPQGMQLTPSPRVGLWRPRSPYPPPTGVSSLLCGLGVISILRRQHQQPDSLDGCMGRHACGRAWARVCSANKAILGSSSGLGDIGKGLALLASDALIIS
jgi:hypothetical protein